MAERLDLGALTSGTRQANPFAGALDEALQPGSVYAGFEGKPGKLSTRLPVLGSMPDILNQGNANLGITAWDQLFGAGGEVLDPMALLRSLNAGQLLSERPMSQSGFNDKYGLGGDGGFSFDVQPRGGGAGSFLYANPTGYRGVSSAFQQARQSNDADLVDWVKSIGLGGRPFEQINFDPGNLRFGSFDLGGGVNLQDTNLDALNQWAMANYGVDLQRLAGSTNELLETRQAWMDDPSLWFNPDDPGVLNTTAIPGLMDQDQALRMQQYQEAWRGMVEAADQQSQMAFSGLLDQALLGDSEYARTAGGQHMMGTVAPTMGYQPQLPTPQDYSFLAAQGLFQDQLAAALTQSGLDF